ncbi:hypothetical protein SETIT_9G360500v2 [Setaria italica]|uniref:Terpene synthase N-terminal domain-containing protein n=1 Tax=Setaria italica TaxID=4555 RepID=K4AKB8_SETIT|nr:hypothetical protein SETIT_9G360500v2 [Setaria italica]
MIESRDVLMYLVNEARKMLVGTPVQRLGISYHFQEEIHASLEKFSTVEFNNESFHDISLQFRLLRQERHYISCGASKYYLTSIPSTLLIRVINLAQTMETTYKNIDGYTDSK